MKKKFLHIVTTVTLMLLSGTISAQAPNLGTAADFVLFTSVGAMQSVGTYQYLTLLTGNVGTNSGSNTNFGNVNGVMHSGDGASGQCAIDLLTAYNFLAAAIPDSTIVNPVLGNDSTFKAGTYLLPGATSLDKSITLDGQGNPNAVFIFKMPAGPPNYALSTSVNAQVKLINGAQACNVFWFVTGAVSMGAKTSMKGTIIAGGAMTMAAGNTLEGRALTINGSVTVSNGDKGLSAYLPVDISAPLPTGPAAPVFVESKPYGVFSTIGDVSDDGTSHVAGNVGSNTALPTGFNPLFVSGFIEGMNPATAGAAADLLLVYNSLSTLTADIELLAPAQFGHNLVLTPHSYAMHSAVTFTDTLILDASGNEDAVFIIKTYGAFASGVNSAVILKNGTQAKNVFWMVNGAVSIGNNSVFKGTIIANNGAIDLLKDASLDGRALTTNGSVSTTGMTTVLPIPLFSINHEVLFVCDGDSAGLVVSAIGKGSYTFQWRKGNVNLINGGNISGVTNDTLVINPVSASDIGSTYNVLVFDNLQPSDTTGFASISFNPVPTITEQPASQAVCAVGNPTSFSVTAMGAGLTYQWRRGTTNLTNIGNISGAKSNTLTISSVQVLDEATNYNVVVSDICGRNITSTAASLSISTNVIIKSQPANQIACLGSPVSFSVTAIGEGLTYQWRKGTDNLSNIKSISGATSATLTVYSVSNADVASDYNVVVSGTCSTPVTSNDASLVVNAPPTASVTLQPTCVVPTGTITVSSAKTGLTFSIDGSHYTNTTGIFTLVVPGIYQVTAKNANGCISAGTSVVLTQPVAPTAPTASVTLKSTCSIPTGTITVSSAITGLSFSIDGSHYTNTTGIFTFVVPGTYQVTAKDANGCISAGTSVVLTQAVAPTAPTASVTLQPTCGVPTGTITVSSAITGLTFSIDGSHYINTTGIFALVVPGTYQVTAKDAIGCISTGTSVVLTQPVGPTAPTASVTLQPTCDVPTGTITVSSAKTGLSFSIDGSHYTNTTGIFTLVVPGVYQVTAKNANGCISAGTSIVLTQAAAPTAPTASVTLQPTCDVATGTITVSSAKTGLTFSIDGSGYTNTTGIFTSVVTGTYQVTAKNVNGCISAGTSVILTQAVAPTAPTASVTLQPTCDVATGTITVSSAKTGLTFSIDGSGYTNTTGIFTSVVTGVYQVTAKNANGCISAGTSVVLTQPVAPTAPTASVTLQPTCSVPTGTITVSSAITGLSFSIDGSHYTNTTGIFTFVVPGVYQVTAKNANGCISAGTSVVLTQPVAPTAPTASVTLQPTCNVPTGTITVSSAKTGLTFSIDGSHYINTTGIFALVVPGTYQVTAKDAIGCISAGTSVVLTQPVAPTAPVASVTTQLTCGESNGTITVSSAKTGLSFSIDGSDYTNTSGIFTSLAEGTYNVTAKNSSGCVSIATSILLKCVTGIASFDAGNAGKAVSIYPNPFKNSMNIIINDALEINSCNFKIYNVLGVEVIHTNITSQLTTLDTSNLLSGVYFYKVINNGKTIQSGKLISKE